MHRIDNSTELPSRRAGGGFGHSDRVVSNDISDTQYRPLCREHAAAARAGQSKSVFYENEARSKRNDRFAQRRIDRFSLFRFAGF